MTSLTDSQNNISEAEGLFQRPQQPSKVNIRSYRKESYGLPTASVVRQTYGQLSEKKLPSQCNNSASLETLEHESAIGSKGLVDQLRQRVSALQKEVQSLHASYGARLEELTNHHNDKSQKYLTLIHDMHTRHQQEVEYFTNVIAGFEEERSQISVIEQKMNFINAGIEDILRESNEQAQRNSELQKEIQRKDGLIREREQLLELKESMLRQNAELLEGIDQELTLCRQKMTEYETTKQELGRIRAHWERFQKQLVDLIDTTCQELPCITVETECAIGRVTRERCQHCKIQNLGKKVTQTMSRLS